MHKVNLTDCQQTADITPAYTWQRVKQPMIIEFRNHSTNKIDGSNVPVAIIADSENLIRDADEQYERMNWEQEGGELRVFADRDMFEKRVIRDDGTVGVKMTGSLNRLVTMIDGDGSPDGKKITEHAPDLRTTSQNEMFQQILRRIELTCNIGKGTVSDIITKVLKKAGEPLHRDEIVKRVLKSRQVKETTILLNLQSKPEFKRVAKATYTLAELETN